MQHIALLSSALLLLLQLLGHIPLLFLSRPFFLSEFLLFLITNGLQLFSFFLQPILVFFVCSLLFLQFLFQLFLDCFTLGLKLEFLSIALSIKESSLLHHCFFLTGTGSLYLSKKPSQFLHGFLSLFILILVPFPIHVTLCFKLGPIFLHFLSFFLKLLLLVLKPLC